MTEHSAQASGLRIRHAFAALAAVAFGLILADAATHAMGEAAHISLAACTAEGCL